MSPTRGARFSVLGFLVFAACANPTPTTSPAPEPPATPAKAPAAAPARPSPAPQPAPAPSPPPGGDHDEHGCKASAGYMWCAKENTCVRPWELAKAKGFDNSAAGLNAYCNR